MIKSPWNVRQDRYVAILAVLNALDAWAIDECRVANEVLLARVRKLIALGCELESLKQRSVDACAFTRRM